MESRPYIYIYIVVQLTMNMTILEVKFYTNIKLQCIIKLCPSLANNTRNSNNEIKRQLLSPPEVTHT